MLDDLGYTGNRPYYTGRSGYVLANLPGLSNVHTVNLETGTAVCGQQPKTRRELWVEHSEVPKGQRECPRCRKWNLFEKTGAYLNVDDDDL